jgi:hypothetical protein
VKEQETYQQYCKNYEVAADLLNSWPAIHSTDETVAHIDQFQIVDLKSGGVVVFILWRQVER